MKLCSSVKLYRGSDFKTGERVLRKGLSHCATKIQEEYRGKIKCERKVSTKIDYADLFLPQLIMIEAI